MSADRILTNTQGREYYIYQLGLLTDKLQNRVNNLENNYKNVSNAINNGATIGNSGLTRPYTLSYIKTINSTTNDELDLTNSESTIRKRFINTMYLLYRLYYIQTYSNTEEGSDEFKSNVVKQLNTDFNTKIKINPFKVDEISYDIIDEEEPT